MKFPKSILVLSLLALPLSNFSAHAEGIYDFNAELTAIRAKCDFRSDMRKLWEDHITWTRLFIISATANAPDKAAVTKRLLQNQVDIGNAIKPYYGVEAGNKLTRLLTDHILIAANIVAAASAKNSDLVNRQSALWVTNADDISLFLSQENPQFWPLADMKSMMHKHLDLTTEELKAHLQKVWSADIAAYDRVHLEILQMSDMLASGIMQQFPNQFH